MKEFVAKFKALLAENKIEEAKALIGTFGSVPETVAERAEFKLALTDLYIQLTNAANETYLAVLKEAVAKLQFLDAKEREIDEKAKLIQTRASLVQ